jgi:FAD/FMN-containing dehydrogenase
VSAPFDAALVAFADEVGASGPVAVEGGRTRWSSGGDLEPGARLVRAPAGILEHRPEEMVVRVRAGTTVGELHGELALAGQRTALPERGGTVGGALAVAQDGLHALGRGKVRSAVLQARYVSAEGRVVTAGGPTVKNVTGFDLPRLVVGSLGTLGLVGEVILRTQPVPARSGWVVACDADPFAPELRSRCASAVLWDGARTWVHLEGHHADVEAEGAALARCASWARADGPPPLPRHRWSLPPGELRALSPTTTPDGTTPNLSPDPEPQTGSWRQVRWGTGGFVALVGVGVVLAERPQPARPPDEPLARLHQRVKELFDPTGRLNPGRNPARR